MTQQIILVTEIKSESDILFETELAINYVFIAAN